MVQNINKIDGYTYTTPPNLPNSGSVNNRGSIANNTNSTRFNDVSISRCNSCQGIPPEALARVPSFAFNAQGSIDVSLEEIEVPETQINILTKILKTDSGIKNHKVVIGNDYLKINNQNILSLKPNTTISTTNIISWSVPKPKADIFATKPWNLIK